ncbi:MAG: hypothetical protein RLN67_11310 [Algiphilus sp.]
MSLRTTGETAAMYRGWLIGRLDGQRTASVNQWQESAVPESHVTVRVARSMLNDKDVLAITGRSPVARVFPTVPGIAFASAVEASADSAFAVGAAGGVGSVAVAMLSELGCEVATELLEGGIRGRVVVHVATP